jgi:hypothetical protein
VELCESTSSRMLYDLYGLGCVGLVLQASMEQQRLGYDDYSEDISGENCTESAAVLAQLRLSQALNLISPPNSRFSDTWQVGPSVSQQEAVRYLLTVLQILCLSLRHFFFGFFLFSS